MQDAVKSILADALQIGNQVAEWGPETRMLGEIPELDSMAVVSVLTMIEEEFGVQIPDDEISAETFETLGSLVSFVSSLTN